MFFNVLRNSIKAERGSGKSPVIGFLYPMPVIYASPFPGIETVSI